MRGFLNRIPYTILIPAAILLGLTPFYPQPHAVEKIRMLANGTLHRVIDIFDLLMHLSPTFLLLCKWLLGQFTGHHDRNQT